MTTRPRHLPVIAAVIAAWAFPALARAQAPAARRQTQADDYTRYELLAPDSARFRIVYDVTATTPGAIDFFNVIRKGSEASDEAVYDRMTGAPLKFEVVTGGEARAAGLAGADADASYIRIHLARPVPADGGEARLRIVKTYKDAKSYYREADLIVFARTLGIKRNAVVLPPGYELVSCNYPSQILAEPDGRTRVSFINIGPGEVPLVVKARPPKPPVPKEPEGAALRPAATDRAPSTGGQRARAPEANAAGPAAAPADSSSLTERAVQDRKIVYFLHEPDTHAFSLYHDYTESRPGVDRYLNVVRAGSAVSNPSARILDTGEPLKVETLEGDAITRAGLDIGEAVGPASEVVVVRFPAVKAGQSVRLRIEETYTDAARYRLEGGALAWDRSFGRPFNAIVLPAGWYVTASSIPAVVTRLDDGRTRLDYVNPRPDQVDVRLRARRR